MSDMPSVCPHDKRTWFNQTDGSAIARRHRPVSDAAAYDLVQSQPSLMLPWTPSDVHAQYASTAVAAYPHLLNRYLGAKLMKAIKRRRESITPGSDAEVLLTTPTRQAMIDALAPRIHPFRERIHWKNPLRGIENTGPTEKEKADHIAIAGLRNSAATLTRLTYSAQFGLALGVKLRAILREHPDWITDTCKVIGTKKEDKCKPPCRSYRGYQSNYLEGGWCLHYRT